jgi:hypothetical protein
MTVIKWGKRSSVSVDERRIPPLCGRCLERGGERIRVLSRVVCTMDTDAAARSITSKTMVFLPWSAWPMARTLGFRFRNWFALLADHILNAPVIVRGRRSLAGCKGADALNPAHSFHQFLDDSGVSSNGGCKCIWLQAPAKFESFVWQCRRFNKLSFDGAYDGPRWPTAPERMPIPLP